jgi:Rrf2 family iron-sulfur cluster assembly transcriptional regulator
MRLSTKGRYAVTAMMDLAIHETHGPVPLSEVAVCQSISLSYLEQLFARLRRKGLVKSVRGVKGGYLLGRPASEITVADVFTAVEEKMDLPEKPSDTAENLSPEQVELESLWYGLSERLFDFLSGISLANCINQPYVQEVIDRQDASHGRARVELSVPSTGTG